MKSGFRVSEGDGGECAMQCNWSKQKEKEKRVKTIQESQ